MEKQIFKQVDQYINRLLAEEDDDHIYCKTLLAAENIPDASISPNQGKLLQVLASACRAKRILELGTLGAYSTLWLAKSLPPGGKLTTIEFNEHHAAVAKKVIAHAGLQHKIELLTGPALPFMEQMVQRKTLPFDLIFIDADKPPYDTYIQLALQLARSGSIIVCDNVIREGKILDVNSADEKVEGVQRLNHFLKTCDDVTATIIQTIGEKPHDGMVIAVVN